MGGMWWREGGVVICFRGRCMSKPPCCSCGTVDSRRGCGGIWWKWSCVFKGLEMDKFPFGWGRGTPES